VICHLTSSYPTARVPYAGHFVEALAKAQMTSGASVAVIAPGAARPPDSPFLRLHEFPAPASFDVSGGLKGQIANNLEEALPALPEYAYRMLAAVLGEARTAEVLHAHWLAPSGAVALFARALIGVPVVITARGSDVELLERLPGPWGLLARDIPVAAVSATLAERLRRLGFLRVRTIEQPLSVAYDQPGPWGSREAGRFLWVGSLVRGKRPELALEALKQVPAATMEIAGDGPLRKELEILATTLGIETRVTFHGAVPPGGIAPLHRTAGALIFTSEAEGRPNAVLEAAWLGTPVIASAIAPVACRLRHGLEARLFPPGNATALAGQMREHLKHWHSSRQLAERAKESLDLPGWAETVSSYAELYRSARLTTSI